MVSISLAGLRYGKYNQIICVRVSRLWHFHGGLELGPIKFMHIVLIDEQGNDGYAIVPPLVVRAYLDVFNKGRVYQISDCTVSNRPTVLNPAASPFMILIGRSTGVQPVICLPKRFPEWTYMLLSLEDLPSPSDVPENFIDVIGVIRAISPSFSYQVPGTWAYVVKSGCTVKITLWGEAAVRCDDDGICVLGQEQAVVAIFVGTTVRVKGGVKELSGKSACKWYVNEDILEIHDFRSRYRLYLIAEDKSGEAEFTLYGRNAEQVVGLPALCVLENNRPDVLSIRNNHVDATLIRHVPEELSKLVSMRCI